MFFLLSLYCLYSIPLSTLLIPVEYLCNGLTSHWDIINNSVMSHQDVYFILFVHFFDNYWVERNNRSRHINKHSCIIRRNCYHSGVILICTMDMQFYPVFRQEQVLRIDDNRVEFTSFKPVLKVIISVEWSHDPLISPPLPLAAGSPWNKDGIPCWISPIFGSGSTGIFA